MPSSRLSRCTTRTTATETLAVVEVATGATLATSMAWAVAWVLVDMACSRVRMFHNPAHLHVVPDNDLMFMLFLSIVSSQGAATVHAVRWMIVLQAVQPCLHSILGYTLVLHLSSQLIFIATN